MKSTGRSQPLVSDARERETLEKFEGYAVAHPLYTMLIGTNYYSEVSIYISTNAF